MISIVHLPVPVIRALPLPQAFAQLEAHKDELLSGGGGTREGAGGPAMAAQGAEESLGGGQPVVAVSADTSPQPEGGGGGGGICWLAGVDNNGGFRFLFLGHDFACQPGSKCPGRSWL